MRRFLTSDGRSRLRPSVAAGLLFAACLGANLLLADASDEAPDGASSAPLPRELSHDARYATSSSCRECHPDQFASWHRTYHRTMTQAATPESVVGKFDGTVVDSAGLLYRVFERDGQPWAEAPDPDAMLDRQMTFEFKSAAGRPVEPLHWNGIPRVERRVVMSTGSHHYQTYWVESAKYPGTLMTLPLVYLIKDGRWIPREAAFLYPPGPRRMVTIWNGHCINCHSTGPVPAPFEEVDAESRKIISTGFKSRVGELGIACEACHGPATEHIALRRAEAARGSATAGAGDASAVESDTIVHPGALEDHERSAQICGQCHGAYIRDEAHGLEYRDKGIDFLPGQDLLAVRHYIFPPQDDPTFYKSDADRQQAIQAYAANPQFFREHFWENGDVLAGGREFTALAMSACYRRGEISCVSCHSMHGGDPNDQLIPDASTDSVCLKCHQEDRFHRSISEHTHHGPSSSGSSCVNCHMPHTTYALFGAIRTHKIASPDLQASAAHGVPNACNLCHLDKTLEWTADTLSQWYGHEKPELSYQQRRIAASVAWMLSGHAAQRVIAAWHVGWKAAREASGEDWLAPLVARLLADPYGVVRYVAAESLRQLPGFADFKFDFMAPADVLSGDASGAVQRWRSLRQAPLSRTGKAVLMLDDGNVDEEGVHSLLLNRDNRPIAVKE